MKQEIQEGIPPRKKNDIVSKAAFHEWFPELLRFLYPNADQIFDFSRGFVAMDKELLEIMPERERAGGTVTADMLMNVYLLDGTEQWILCHLEIEGQSKENFAIRMLRYWYRLFDHYGVDVISIAIFTGGKAQIRPNAYHFDKLGTEIMFKYKTYHVFDHSEEDLLAMANPVALVILACQAEAQEERLTEEQLNDIKNRIIEALIAHGGYDTGQIIRFVRFLNNLIYLKNPKLNRMFVDNVEKLTKGKVTMGIMETIDMLIREETELKVEEKKNTEFVTKLISDFGFTDEQAAKAATVSVKFVQKVRALLAKKQKI